MADDSIGALWEKKASKSGLTFFSGTVTIGDVACEVVIFKNNYKKEPKHPDWKVYRSKPRETQTDMTPF